MFINVDSNDVDSNTFFYIKNILSRKGTVRFRILLMLTWSKSDLQI